MSHPFIIWTMQRTGGTSLTELLMEMSEHKSAEPEPFNGKRQFGDITRAWHASQDDTELFRALRDIFSERYLIKHCYELHPELSSRLMEAAAKTEYRHVHLMRRDELSRLISKFVAQAHGTWHKPYASKVFAKVLEGRRALTPLPVDQVVEHYRKCQRISGEISALMHRLGIPSLEITYEDLYKGEREIRVAWLNKLLGFLDFSPQAVEQYQGHIEEKIFNSGHDTAAVMPAVPNIREVVDALVAAGCAGSAENVLSRAEPLPAESRGDGAAPASGGARDRLMIPPADVPAAKSGWRGKNKKRSEQPGPEHEPARGKFRSGFRDDRRGPAIGEAELGFLTARGLRPSDRVIDIGCGALDGGAPLIRFLAPGCYHGIDKHIEPIICGVAEELGVELFLEKKPRFAISSRFELRKFGAKFTFGIARSAFMQLAARDVFLCLNRLYRAAEPGCRFYAGFCDGAATGIAETRPGKTFVHSPDELRTLGALVGWRTSLVGGWGQPQGGLVMEFLRA